MAVLIDHTPTRKVTHMTIDERIQAEGAPTVRVPGPLTLAEVRELRAAAEIDAWWRRDFAEPAPNVPQEIDQLTIRCLVRRGLLTHNGEELLTDAGRAALGVAS